MAHRCLYNNILVIMTIKTTLRVAHKTINTLFQIPSLFMFHKYNLTYGIQVPISCYVYQKRCDSDKTQHSRSYDALVLHQIPVIMYHNILRTFVFDYFHSVICNVIGVGDKTSESRHLERMCARPIVDTCLGSSSYRCANTRKWRHLYL